MFEQYRDYKCTATSDSLVYQYVCRKPGPRDPENPYDNYLRACLIVNARDGVTAEDIVKEYEKLSTDPLSLADSMRAAPIGESSQDVVDRRSMEATTYGEDVRFIATLSVRGFRRMVEEVYTERYPTSNPKMAAAEELIRNRDKENEQRAREKQKRDGDQQLGIQQGQERAPELPTVPAQ